MSIEQKLETMLDLQDAMNSKINPAWRLAGNAWYRAIWVEFAELLDHYGWKWWKKQEPDTEQVHLELIDIWHFGLSFLLEKFNKQDIINAIQRHYDNPIKQELHEDFRGNVEYYVSLTLSTRQFNPVMFLQLADQAGLSFDKLYKGYIGKNVLNFFRQDNGYKDGTYRKHWYDGREDNEHLVEILETTDDQGEVYKALQVRYNTFH